MEPFSDDRILTNVSNNSTTTPCGLNDSKFVLRGLQPFGYEKDLAALYPNSPPRDASTEEWLVTKKKDGTNVRISAVPGGEWAIGSKNVAVLVRTKQDISAPEWAAPRYKCAKRIADQFLSLLETLPELIVEMMRTHLLNTGQTLVGELVVADEPRICPDVPGFYFYSLADARPYQEGLTAGNPLTCLRKMEAMRLPFVEYRYLKTVSELLQVLAEYRMMDDIEGVVVTRVVKGRAVAMHQIKNSRYMALRVAMELVGHNAIEMVARQRIDRLPVGVTRSDRTLALKLFAIGRLKRVPRAKWMQFVASVGEISDQRVEAALGEIDAVPQSVALCGIPGSGKTMLGRVISRLLNLPLISSDETGFLRQIRQSMCKRVGAVIDRSNHTVRSRDQIGVVAGDVIWVVLNRRGLPPDVQTCLARIVKRGYGHRSLHPGANTLNILNQFARDWEEPKATAKTLFVDPNEPLVDNARLVAAFLGTEFDAGVVDEAVEAESAIRAEMAVAPRKYYSVDVTIGSARSLGVNIPMKFHQPRRTHVTLWHKNDGTSDTVRDHVGERVEFTLDGAYADHQAVILTARANVDWIYRDGLHVTLGFSNRSADGLCGKIP